MAGNRKAYNSQQTREYIKETFLRLYAKKGMQGVSVVSLCNECGIVRSTFYSYFDDKYAVLEEIGDDYIEKLRAINTPIPEYSFEVIKQGLPSDQIDQTIAFIRENRQQLRLLLSPNETTAFENKWRRGMEYEYVQLFKGMIRNPVQLELSKTIFAYAAMGIYTNYILGKLELTQQELTATMGSVFQYSLYGLWQSKR